MFKASLTNRINDKLNGLKPQDHERYLRKLFIHLDQKHSKLLKRKLKKARLWESIEKIRNETEDMMYYTQGYTLSKQNLIIEYGTKSVQTGLPQLDYILEEYFDIRQNQEDFIILKGFFSIPQYKELILLYHYFYSLHSYPALAV